MLEYLHLKNVGPSPEMEMNLAPRLNLLTGDNGASSSSRGFTKASAALYNMATQGGNPWG